MSTCQHCRHWEKQPVDPHNLGAPRMGACTEHLHSGIVGMQGNQIQSIAYYPQTQDSFPACGRFELRQIEVINGQRPREPAVH